MAVVRATAPRDSSELTFRLTDPDGGGPYKVHFDQWLTRRKRFHIITDHRNGVVFRSRWVSDIHDWLDSRELTEYVAVIDGAEWLVRFARSTNSKRTKQ